jgi:hypothetical protein
MPHFFYSPPKKIPFKSVEFFRGTMKKMGHELFGGLKNIEVIISK